MRRKLGVFIAAVLVALSIGSDNACAAAGTRRPGR